MQYYHMHTRGTRGFIKAYHSSQSFEALSKLEQNTMEIEVIKTNDGNRTFLFSGLVRICQIGPLPFHKHLTFVISQKSIKVLFC